MKNIWFLHLRFIQSLKDKAIIVVAGNPASAEELEVNGTGTISFMSRSNVPETLKNFNNKLGNKNVI